ncbi:MAG TPA: hypothetical protein VEZ11_03395 [Thermoanaerobaculia bacterium]|nr:hypothetical protein [Thermoanaerobaculia bacterium]
MKLRSMLSALFLAVLLATGFTAGRAHAAQPRMAAVVEHLRSARRELETALADKGGHRERAIRIVGEAIRETEAGMEFAREH